MAKVKLLYFSWIRERAGTGEEALDLPDHVVTVTDLFSHLKKHNEAFEGILELPDVIRVAVDQEHVQHSAPIAGAREIALFPPMTGG